MNNFTFTTSASVEIENKLQQTNLPADNNDRNTKEKENKTIKITKTVTVTQ